MEEGVTTTKMLLLPIDARISWQSASRSGVASTSSTSAGCDDRRLPSARQFAGRHHQSISLFNAGKAIWSERLALAHSDAPCRVVCLRFGQISTRPSLQQPYRSSRSGLSELVQAVKRLQS